MFRKIFDQKLEAGEILFQNEGPQNVHDRPFPDHGEGKGKAQVMMISSADEELTMLSEEELSLDQRALKVQELFKFKSFYDHMDFNSKQRLAIAKAIMKLTDSTEGVNPVEKRIGRNSRFEDNALVFYENTRRDVPIQHNQPLYVTARVRDTEMRRVLIDAGSSLNIISLDILDDIGIPREKIQKQPFEVSSFNGSRTYTVGSLSLDLTVGPIRVAHRFHVIDTHTSYHLLLGRPWIHKYSVPSTYHQCLKAL